MAILAEATFDMAPVISGLTTGIKEIGGSALAAVGGVVPLAIPIMGAVGVVSIGIKAFKKVVGW